MTSNTPKTRFHNPLSDPEQARGMYRLIQKIYDHWDLSKEERMLLLGLTDEAYRTIEHSGALPATEEMRMRVSDTITIFRMLATIYCWDFRTVGCRWIKRRNWRPPFYGKRPLEYIRTGYGALQETRRHLKACVHKCGGVFAGRGNITHGINPGEILGFNDFLHMQGEDADVLAIMMLRVFRTWRLSWKEAVHIGKCDRMTFSRTAKQKYFPDETLLTHWRMILMINCGAHILQGSGGDSTYDWMHTSNILLRGSRPIDLVKNGHCDDLVALMKQTLDYTL